jgi:hypothetical protein
MHGNRGDHRLAPERIVPLGKPGILEVAHVAKLKGNGSLRNQRERIESHQGKAKMLGLSGWALTKSRVTVGDHVFGLSTLSAKQLCLPQFGGKPGEMHLRGRGRRQLVVVEAAGGNAGEQGTLMVG